MQTTSAGLPMDSWNVALVVGLGLLVVIYGVVKYRLTVRGEDPEERVKTPTLDRMSTEALHEMTGSEDPEGKGAVPGDRDVVPTELLTALSEQEKNGEMGKEQK